MDQTETQKKIQYARDNAQETRGEFQRRTCEKMTEGTHDEMCKD